MVTTIEIKEKLKVARVAAEEAGQVIMEVYTSGDFDTEAKADASPLTKADRLAHEVINTILGATELPILSEEGKTIPYEVRKDWEYFWMVDPLDGTKEFLKRNGEFTVNIALIYKGRPVMGVVSVPVSRELYYTHKDGHAFHSKDGIERALDMRPVLNLSAPGLRVVASRSHLTEETSTFIATLNDPVLVSKGSSLKFMLMAEGSADLYPRYAPTMEWDTAAGHAIVNAVGLGVYQMNSDEELMYNKADLYNPYFLVR